ncbi:MAG: fluoride efflux transporter CrcB [Hyphomicrobiales bacterium]|nr:fluoride efflux transporter CrcB [Hyphomicrobiales bacterium]
MKLVLLVAAGGAIGAVGRYLVGVGAVRLLGFGFPWGTLIVNVLGSLLMGLLIEFIALRLSASNEVRTFLATGVLGSFTTFSAFSLDFAVLMERKEHMAALFYLSASVTFSILALFAGLSLARSLLQ